MDLDKSSYDNFHWPRPPLFSSELLAFENEINFNLIFIIKGNSMNGHFLASIDFFLFDIDSNVFHVESHSKRREEFYLKKKKKIFEISNISFCEKFKILLSE